ncbi:MAG TPA: ABC transporter ATP-binding protein [Candidatus Limnocylindrales bacterium]|nr:ABC transporter ATP-binding protein [Candidatus Limnocylindrales bacterium]
MLALLGPNGAGKTTTVETIEGYRLPDAGTVRVLGLEPRRDRAALRGRTAVMLQRADLWNQCRVGEAVRLFAAFYRDPLPVDEVLERVGLARLAGARYRTLSGGERQRLALALALVGRPELAILDEPTAAMDVTARRQTWELLRELRAGGATILLTTHLLDEAEQLADRVAIIDHGRLLAVGAPADLRAGLGSAPAGPAAEGGAGGLAAASASGSASGSAVGQRRLRLDLRTPLDDGQRAALAALAGVAGIHDEGPASLLLATSDPGALLVSLAGWLHERRIEPLSISLGEASLEEVFLRLTGSDPEAEA